MSGVELARLCHDKRIPATHTEGEHLRDDAGESPMGGTNMDDLRRGMHARYNWYASLPISGFANLWKVLTPGRAAAAQGRMGVFSSTHRLRRWDKPFSGKHCVLIARVDNTDRVWWCDPLAPQDGTYNGEWVTKAELKKYVDAITAEGGRHVVGFIRKNYVCNVADKARLYVRSDLKPTTKDVIIHPGPRTMPYKGQATAAAKKVEYVNAKGVHTGVLYYAKNAVVSSVRAL